MDSFLHVGYSLKLVGSTKTFIFKSMQNFNVNGVYVSFPYFPRVMHET